MITASLNHNTNSTRGTYIENALALIQGVQNCKTRRFNYSRMSCCHVFEGNINAGKDLMFRHHFVAINKCKVLL